MSWGNTLKSSKIVVTVPFVCSSYLDVSFLLARASSGLHVMLAGTFCDRTRYGNGPVKVRLKS